MGQKINPVALRAKGIGHKKSGWYAPFSHVNSSGYATKLSTEFMIRESLQSLSNVLDLIDVEVSITRTNKILVTLLIPYPEYLYVNLKRRFYSTISQAVKTNRAENLKDSLAELLEWPEVLTAILIKRHLPIYSRISFRVKLVKAPYHNPKFLAKAIQTSIDKRVSIRRAMKLWSQIAMSSKVNMLRVKGVRVKISGRLNGAEMASNQQLSVGKVSLHTILAPVDYYCQNYTTHSGTLGIKVWIAGY